MVLDQSGMYAATSCTDKTLAIYEYESGELAATMFGHSELVTGLKFTMDCKHLVSVSGKIQLKYFIQFWIIIFNIILVNNMTFVLLTLIKLHIFK